MKKRILSIFLAVLLLVSLIPLTAQAATLSFTGQKGVLEKFEIFVDYEDIVNDYRIVNGEVPGMYLIDTNGYKVELYGTPTQIGTYTLYVEVETQRVGVYQFTVNVTIEEYQETVAPDYSSIDVVFTSDSSFKVGGTATVDALATAQNVMQCGSITADMYNAALEQNMTYTWKCSNGPSKYGRSVTWTDADKDREFLCRIGFYNDSACTDLIDFIDSDTFIVKAGASAAKPKLDDAGPFNLTAGEYFSYQLTSNVKNGTYENYRSSFPNGISISSSGKISGTPTKTGHWYVTVVVYDENGEWAADNGYEFTVGESAGANEPPVIQTKKLPDATVGEYYSVQLKCSDAGAEWWEYYNPGKANDLKEIEFTITSSGLLAGMPKKAGTYGFTIAAGNDNGEDYGVYTLTIKEKPAEPDETEPDATEPDATEPVETMPIESEPDATESKPDKIDKGNKVDKTNAKDKEDSEDDDKNDDLTLVIVACIVIVCIAVAGAVLIIILVKRKRSQ